MAVKPTYTKRTGQFVQCIGTNHSDDAQVANCDKCHEDVLLIIRAGKPKRVLNDTRVGLNLKFRCWGSDFHVCDTGRSAHVESVKAYNEANGAILKGTEVVVVRGRKTPIGTEGVVFWLGEDNYGNANAGIKDAEGNTIWTAVSNLSAKWSNEFQSKVAN